MIIFTDSQIRAKRLPMRESQEAAVEILRQAYRNIYELNRGLCASVVIGSTERGDATIASDIDVLAFLDDGARSFWENTGMSASASHLSVALRTIKEVMLVKVEVHPVLMSQVLDRTNLRYDKQYLRHAVVASERGGLLAGSVEEVKHFYDLAQPLTLAMTLSYIDRKVHKVNQGQYSWGGLNEEEEAQFYANIVNSPFHALRRVFTLCGVGYVDCRSGLINSLRDIGDEMTEMRLRFLADLGRQYVLYLECKRDRLPAGINPFEQYGEVRIAYEFREAMAEIRKFALTAAPSSE